MAVGTVSGISDDTYQLIQTIASTSGSTVTFSGISGYKKLIVAWENVGRSDSVTPYMTFNGSTSNYASQVTLVNTTNYQSAIAGIRCCWSTHSSGNTGYYVIENVNNGAPKIVYGELLGAFDQYLNEIRGSWTVADAITSITFTANGTWNAGSMKLYGVAS
jgi:hypothetical protein